MHDTMEATERGSWRRRNGRPLRVVVFGLKHSARYPDAEEVPYTVLINPVITLADEETEDGWEGCLSVPGMRGLVPRWRTVRYQGRDTSGQPIDRTVSAFHARVVQHECDHLDGILYPMRIRDLRNFGFHDVLFPDQPPIDE
jgi:peptide deformylase